MHTIAGRSRLRVPSRKGDAGYFAHVGRALGAEPGVAEVTTNALTGSILVVHRGPADALWQAAASAQLFQVVPASDTAPVVTDLASKGVNRLEQRLNVLTHGRFDLYELIFTGLIGAAIVQMLRGQLLGPASALLSYAAAILVASRARRTL